MNTGICSRPTCSCQSSTPHQGARRRSPGADPSHSLPPLALHVHWQVGSFKVHDRRSSVADRHRLLNQAKATPGDLRPGGNLTWRPWAGTALGDRLHSKIQDRGPGFRVSRVKASRVVLQDSGPMNCTRMRRKPACSTGVLQHQCRDPRKAIWSSSESWLPPCVRNNQSAHDLSRRRCSEIVSSVLPAWRPS